MADKHLFIEGTSDDRNGKLRQAFVELLLKKLSGKMPKTHMCGGKKSAIDQFLNNSFGGTSFLLIDLDAPESKKEADMNAEGISLHKDSVYYMIQEMESWFISQPEVLDKYYGPTKTGKKVSEKLPKRKPSEITSPKDELKIATKDLNKGEEYHEVKHAIKLLTLLDADKLENDFPDFKKLIEKLR